MTEMERRTAAGMRLENAIREFFKQRDQIFRERDEAVLAAAQVLSQKEISELTGLSGETIRKITRNHPVSWPRRVTVQKLVTGGK